MDGAIDAAAAEQRGVRRIDDRVHGERGDVVTNGQQLRGHEQSYGVALPGRRPLVDKLAAREVFDLLGCRSPPQHRIAMGLAPETRDHVTVAARLRRGVLEHRALIGWRIPRELLGQLDGLLEVRQVLGVSKREKEECLLPRRCQRRVVPRIESGARQRPGLRVERICPRIATVDRA